jgi:hypothetical protein
MGLLDDAIREHLELKRRHGADPEEVSRQEREALGAPVRGEFSQPAAEPERAAPESEVDEEPSAEEPAAGDEELEPSEEALAVPEPGTEEDPWLVEKLADEPPPEEPPEAEPPAEDVLEETPEFLQETPEHDRLWFEQKPPRDFDWDK